MEAARRPDMPPLRRSELHEDPIVQLGEWLERARRDVPLAEAMTLATVDEAGAPDARMVLLKGLDAEGLRFFTSYTSAKGRQLGAVPRAAVVLYWRELDRQVRARGSVKRLAPLDSDAYFATRTRQAQLGALASPQSERLASRAELDRLVEETRQRLSGAPVERPAFWGGYLLRPEVIELWQGQVARLHDRFRYTREADGWRLERLAP